MNKLPALLPRKDEEQPHPCASKNANNSSKDLIINMLFHKDIACKVALDVRGDFWYKQHKIAKTIIVTGRVIASNIYPDNAYLHLDDGTAVLKVKLPNKVFEGTDISKESHTLRGEHFRIHGQLKEFGRDKLFYVQGQQIYRTTFDEKMKSLMEIDNLFDQINSE